MTIIKYGGGPNPPVRLDKWQNIVGVGWGDPGESETFDWVYVFLQPPPLSGRAFNASLEWDNSSDSILPEAWVGRRYEREDNDFPVFGTDPGDRVDELLISNFIFGERNAEDFRMMCQLSGPLLASHPFLINLKKLREQGFIWDETDPDGSGSGDIGSGGAATKELRILLKTSWWNCQATHLRDVPITASWYAGGTASAPSAQSFRVTGGAPLGSMTWTIDRDFMLPSLFDEPSWADDQDMGELVIDLENRMVTFEALPGVLVGGESA
jgi:hypothetical protein